MVDQTKPLTVRERRSLVSTIRLYRKAARTVGLTLYDIRETNGDGVRYHGFGCHGFTVELDSGKIVPGTIRHYSGSLYEPPSDEWEPVTDEGPFETWAAALRWLIEAAHQDKLHCALDDASQWAHWREEHRDGHIARRNNERKDICKT